MSTFAQAIFFNLKAIIRLIGILSFFAAQAQDLAVFEDDRRHFYVFENNEVKKLEFIPVTKYVVGRDYVAYINNLFEFKLYYHGKKYTIMPFKPDSIIANDYLLGYFQGSQLGTFNGKVSFTLQNWIDLRSYSLGDSFFVFVDNFEMLQAYAGEDKKMIEKWIPENFVFWGADNLFAYLNNRDELVLLQKDFTTQIIDSYKPIRLKAGRNVLAYFDYMNNFKIWSYGNSELVETNGIVDFYAANDFVVYYNNLNQWIGYYNGQKTDLLSYKPPMMDIKRNMMVFSDQARNFYCYYKGQRIKLENYVPKKYKIDDDMLVYTDLYGKLVGVLNGQKIEVTDQIVIDFELFNKSVVYYEITPAQKKVWSEGKVYTFITSTVNQKNKESKY